ncbi:hypothetical protein BACI348_40163 [Bacillus altitudinis]|uniref:Uncharacterized protein n=1 Tax=Bacillus altitudinis TaxID=293387 RepID=A0A653NRY7_BACAB|nr:hypothetical protein BACI9J_130172 [Bacillus altitudinis]VXB20489.1 hypothetical protein BACI348_40163 [Bacillus altitudinis]
MRTKEALNEKEAIAMVHDYYMHRLVVPSKEFHVCHVQSRRG